MKNTDQPNVGMGPGDAQGQTQPGGGPQGGLPHQSMGGPMGMSMGGMPGSHNGGMPPGVNGGGMQHGVPPQGPAGQMQMQGMRYDQRNDNPQYHGMHPYGPMPGMPQPGMGMGHGMDPLRGFAPNPMHPMGAGQPPQMAQMAMGQMGQMQPNDPAMLGPMGGQMGPMGMGMPPGGPGGMMPQVGVGAPGMQGGMTMNHGGRPPQDLNQGSNYDDEEENSASGGGGNNTGHENSGHNKGSKGGGNDASGGQGGGGAPNSKTTKKQLAKQQKEEVKKQKREQLEAKKQQKEREKQEKQRQKELKKEAKTNPKLKDELKQLQMQQKTAKNGGGDIGGASANGPNDGMGDDLEQESAPMQAAPAGAMDPQSMPSNLQEYPSPEQIRPRNGAPADGHAPQIPQEQHRQHPGEPNLRPGDEGAPGQNMNDVSQDHAQELMTLRRHIEQANEEMKALRRKEQEEGQNPSQTKSQHQIDSESAERRARIKQVDMQMTQWQQKYAALQQRVRPREMAGVGPGVGGHGRARPEASGGGSGSANRQYEQPGNNAHMQQEDDGLQGQNNGDQMSKAKQNEAGGGMGGHPNKQLDPKSRSDHPGLAGAGNPQHKPDSQLAAQHQQQQPGSQMPQSNPGSQQQYPGSSSGQNPNYNKGNQFQDQQQLMQNQQQYQQAQHQAAQQQLRNAVPNGQITQAVKAMLLQSGQMPNPFGGFPGMPGGPPQGGSANGNNMHPNGVAGSGPGAGQSNQQSSAAAQQARGLIPGVMNPQNMAQLGVQFGLSQSFDANQLSQLLQIQQRAALAGMQGMPPGIGMMGGLPPGVPFNNMQAPGNMMVPGQQAAAAGLPNMPVAAFGPGGVPIVPGGVGIPGMPQGIHPQLNNQQALLALYQSEQMRASQAQNMQQKSSTQPPQHYNEANGGRSVPTDKKEQLFDLNLQKSMQELKMEEREICGVRIKMPHLNLNNLKGYDNFMSQESFKNKLQFLRKTVYNTKQIKKTLDLRKFADIERKGRLKIWKDKPEQMIKQKINVRRLKIRIKRQLERQKKKDHTPKNKYECPVYLCTSKHPTEDALVDHYNKDHADLVALGLKLRKSKKARNEERLRKAKEKANRIVIDDPNNKEQPGSNDPLEKALRNYEACNKMQEGSATVEQLKASSTSVQEWVKWDQKKKKSKKDKNAKDKDNEEVEEKDDERSGSESSSESEMDDGSDGNDNQGERQLRDNNLHSKNMWNINDDDPKCDIYGKRHGAWADGNLDDDSDLEDLLELEKVEIEKKKRREQKRQLRRQQRGEAFGEDQQMSEGQYDDDDDDASLADSYNALLDGSPNQIDANGNETNQPQDRLTAIQRLIQQRKAKKASQMKAKISNEFIDQILIFTLINKGYIKETLQKEYQKKLDAEISELYKDID